jgi:hypothetical protein
MPFWHFSQITDLQIHNTVLIMLDKTTTIALFTHPYGEAFMSTAPAFVGLALAATVLYAASAYTKYKFTKKMKYRMPMNDGWRGTVIEGQFSVIH